jgi:hypothetical protein
MRHGRTIAVTVLDPIEVAPRKRGPGFVKVPVIWIDKLAGQGASVYAVAFLLLHLNFKSYQRTFKLTNTAMERLKLSRFAKYRALDQLERLGLISVERRPGKAPLVTIQTG